RGIAGCGAGWSVTREPWRSIDDLEIAVAEYIDWFNHRRLHGEIGMISPVEAEQSYYDSHSPAGTTERVVESLY
ncbi:IS3 family transposase, partial [Rhodococcus rhodochrous]|uniref:IS3 family transposase n=1 Tax=Rhodococcus rhodochrous TaxID=1829 RepID=UPI000A7B41AE